MFSIGEFSKICQVSIKTLHYYDKIGLVEPEYVDQVTGYRYYNKAQMKKILLIQRLKRYEFSLEEIGEILACTEKRALFSKLQKQKEKLKAKKMEMEMAISELSSHLANFERTGDIMGYQKKYEIQLKKTEKVSVLASRQKMSVEEFGKYYGKIYERVPRERVTPNGLVGAVYHDREFDRECSDIELIIGIRESEKADRILEGGLCACTVHKGPYSSLPDGYGAVVAWLEESEWEMSGAPYEFYIKSQFDSLSPEDWVTEIYFPVKKK